MAEEHGGGGGGSHDEHKKHKGHGGHGGGHGKHEEHEEGVPEWVVSFADNALLQMGFFVILLAMNLKPASSGSGGAPADNKEDDVGVPVANTVLVDSAIAIRQAFNNPVNMNSAAPSDQPLIRRIKQKKEGEAKVEGPEGDKPDVASVRPTDYHRVGGVVTFEENAAAIDADGQKTASALAGELRGRKTIVEIRGHASLAEAAEPLDKGMSLSFQRALAVAQELRTGGVEWEQIRVVAVGSGDRAKPLARSAREHQNNQRVEIIITDEQVPADPYASDPAANAKSAPMPH